MRLLLDTHTVFWWLVDKDQLSPIAHAAIEAENNAVYVSVASAWEMAIKVGLRKWPEAAGLVGVFEFEIAEADFRILPISVEHVRSAGLMQAAHRDPFDRLLAAQARIEELTLVTTDAKLQGLGANWIW